MGGWRVVADRNADLAVEQRPLAVDRLTQRIDDAAALSSGNTSG